MAGARLKSARDEFAARDWPFAGVTELLRSSYFRPAWPEARHDATGRTMILVLPTVGAKNIEIARGISEILFQIAVVARVALDL